MSATTTTATAQMPVAVTRTARGPTQEEEDGFVGIWEDASDVVPGAASAGVFLGEGS